MLNPISSALADVIVGLAPSFGRLSVIPLISRHPREDSGFITLERALADGVIEVTEVSEAGHVPELTVVNSGQKPVLLLDGEELIGAKQNRIVNLTILVPAIATILIPVSCVEAGRWNRRGRAFGSSGNAQYARARAQKVAQVSHSLDSLGEARADQHWIWDDIAAKSSRMAAASNTAAMSEIFEVHRRSVDDYLKAFPRVDGQVGAVFAVDHTPVGLDLFADEQTFAALFPKILRSYALDMLDPIVGECPTLPYDSRHAAEVFIKQLSEAASKTAKNFSAVGLGETARVSDGRMAAAALLVENQVIHLAAFDLSYGA